MVQVRRARVDQWQLVKQVRLEALAEAPDAFGSTLAREVAFADDVWLRRVRDGDWFLAWAEEQVVGLAAAVTETDRPDERHLTAMWVRPAQRGGGAAGAILETIWRWARAQGAEGVTLWVTDDNARARRCYEKAGFTATGQRQALPRAPHVGEERWRLDLTVTHAGGVRLPQALVRWDERVAQLEGPGTRGHLLLEVVWCYCHDEHPDGVVEVDWTAHLERGAEPEYVSGVRLDWETALEELAAGTCAWVVPACSLRWLDVADAEVARLALFD